MAVSDWARRVFVRPRGEAFDRGGSKAGQYFRGILNRLTACDSGLVRERSLLDRQRLENGPRIGLCLRCIRRASLRMLCRRWPLAIPTGVH